MLWALLAWGLAIQYSGSLRVRAVTPKTEHKMMYVRRVCMYVASDPFRHAKARVFVILRLYVYVLSYLLWPMAQNDSRLSWKKHRR